jgi:hypothetical protein
MSGPASLLVILSSNLIALGRTARCCALPRELDPGSMRRGRYRYHSDTTGNGLKAALRRAGAGTKS